MTPKFEWRGRQSIDAGAATFSIGDKSVCLVLDKFSDGHEMHALVMAAYEEGKKDARSAMADLILSAIKKEIENAN